MRIGFVVNDLTTERAGYTTTHLAMTAAALGHEVWHMGVADLALDRTNHVVATGVRLPPNVTEPDACIEYLTRESQRPDGVIVDSLDVLFLRNDPSLDALHRPWARLAGINFGRFAQQAGVLVVNEPDGLNRAINKLYLQYFPPEVRPEAIVSRHQSEILNFVQSIDGLSVIKPLTGSGGHDVFVLDPGDTKNLHQMIEAVTEEGFALVQTFLPGAEAGDIRLLMLEGEILQVAGQEAAILRQHTVDDMRNNVTVGAKPVVTTLTPTMRKLARIVGPRLKADGIFLAGVDIAGDQILEINVFSPGSMVSASALYGVSFEAQVIEALERKLEGS